MNQDATRQDAAANEGQPGTPTLSIEKIYVKDVSVEVPHAPEIFLERGEPQIDIQLNNIATSLGNHLFNAVLTVTVSAKLGEKALFLVEVHQAGIFRVMNVPPQELEAFLAIACPNILQPYAREVISDVIVRAGFPSVLLQPINFEALYFAQKQEEAKKRQEGTTAEG
ncbi:MAG: protein-export chaperone SecB [Zoogloeaceae bacterium]|jgi:preprotein translocase subunit SecB|nr:protein-export chaperone SecB [Zoogloeaceae bacterium]